MINTEASVWPSANSFFNQFRKKYGIIFPELLTPAKGGSDTYISEMNLIH